MPKNNFLLVDLNEAKTKKLTETITSDTSRKILNYLAEKEHDTEANIAESMFMPISTVHYHLQRLQEAGLVIVKEFHYSEKGREINHYELANKYIIIAPKKVSGLKEKLKGILPVAIITLGISAVIKLAQSTNKAAFSEIAQSEQLMKAAPMAADAVEETAQATVATEKAAVEAVPEVTNYMAQGIQQPDIAFWFFIGSVVTIITYLSLVLIRYWWNKRKLV